MKRVFLIYFIFLFSSSLFSQIQHVDSLLHILNTQGQELTSDKQLELYDKISRLYIKFDLNKCIEYADKGLQLALKEKDKRMTSVFYRYLGVAYHEKSSMDTSYIYLEKALTLAFDAKDEELQMIAYGTLGNWSRLKHDYEEALDYYMKVLSFHDVPISAVHASTLNNIATIHRILNNADRSIYYFEQALEVSEQLNLNGQRMEATYGLGTTFADRGDRDKASDYFVKALEISRQLDNKPYEIISVNSLATILCQNKEFDKALVYAEEGLKVSEAYGNPRHILGSWGTLADIYREMGDYKKCEEAALKSWAMDSTSVEDASFTAYTLTIANMYLGQKERGKYFLKKYSDIMKAGNEKSLHNSLANMEVKYETEKKEIRIVALEKEKQLYLWLTIAGSIAVLMSLGVLFYRHRLNIQKRKTIEQEREITRRKIEQLEKEKQLIATQAILDGETAERSRLARDLHDGLGGMLSVVKLNLENQQNKAMRMLDESIAELRRIAHHMMPESLMHSGLKLSLEDFCRVIPNAHFQFVGEDSRLDSRLEVVLYRCGYELINNAVKYANASNINVQLLIEKKIIALTVDDDGVGFNPDKIVSGTGLENIRARVQAYNGKITIRSAPQEGTKIIIEIELI